VSEPTPEEAADLPDRVIKALLDNQTRVRKLFRRWLIVASLVLGTGVGYVAWTVHGGTTVIYQIRDSQVANAKVSNHRASCDEAAYADLAYDLKLIVKPGETPKQFLGQIKVPGTKC
jgi:hypothetical protein